MTRTASGWPALAAILLAGTAGCAGPRPATPTAASVAPPAEWRSAPARTGSGPVRADWWQAFGDPALSDLIDRALAANPDIAIAAERVEEARAQEHLAHAQELPNISGSLGAAEARSVTAFGTPSTSLGAQPTIGASYDLDLFGRLRQADAAARAALLATEGARDTVRLAIASSVASGYINLRALDTRLGIAQATLASRADALRIARRRAETGYTSNLELHQAEAEYKSTEQLVPQVKLLITRQENGLRLLAGEVPGAPARGLALQRLAIPAVPDGLPADLLRRRPDLFQAEQSVVAADHSLDSARAAFLPTVSLTGSVGLVLSTALANPIGVFSLGGSILAPLLDSGRMRAQADAAAARRNQAAFAYRKAALTAFREVDDSLAGVARLREQEAAIVGQRDAAAAALRNATNRYRAGYSPYLEQLDAQRTLLTADLAAVQARADRLTSYVTLYQAMGGGWTLAPDLASASRSSTGD
ncbi:efflux transporter outer membrane subunit [Novosphingobium lentum]|uniref:efflux transporter outer membrane subunit n=1 Tax=Novosphingobium lentum TaxID=145287 RepID=UPI000833F586|nr:efflux transporter outer membrane subunit [Novosphingobium lentum]